MSSLLVNYCVSDDPPRERQAAAGPACKQFQLEAMENSLKRLVERQGVLAEVGFSVMSWTESDDIGYSVGAMGSKAQDVMGLDVSVAVGH